LNSVLAQTYLIHEILVVADTDRAFDVPDDPRIQVIRVGPGAGGNVARQVGIEHATGDVIALLDDDDLWLPNKISRQIAQARPQIDSGKDWIASCRTEAHGLREGVAIWPGRRISHQESLPEYMFMKRRIRGGTGMMQASMLVFPRALALRVPFDRSLRFHQDISWLIDVAHASPDVVIHQVWEPLSVYEVTLGTGSVSQTIKIDASLDWAKDRLKGDGARVLGDFILTHTLVLALRSGSAAEVVRVAIAGMRVGRPGMPALGYAGATLVKSVLAKIRLGIH